MAKKRKKKGKGTALTGLLAGLAEGATERLVKTASEKLGVGARDWDDADADERRAKKKAKTKKNKGNRGRKGSKTADRLLDQLADVVGTQAGRVVGRLETMSARREGLLDQLQELYQTIGSSLQRFGRETAARVGAVESPPPKSSKKRKKKAKRAAARSRSEARSEGQPPEHDEEGGKA